MLQFGCYRRGELETPKKHCAGLEVGWNRQPLKKSSHSLFATTKKRRGRPHCERHRKQNNRKQTHFWTGRDIRLTAKCQEHHAGTVCIQHGTCFVLRLYGRCLLWYHSSSSSTGQGWQQSGPIWYTYSKVSTCPSIQIGPQWVPNLLYS